MCACVCLLSHISPLEHLFVLKYCHILSGRRRSKNLWGFLCIRSIAEIQHRSIESLCTVCHFPAESADAHYIARAFSRFVHMWHRRFCTSVHSFTLVLHGPRLFLFILQEVHCLQNSNMTLLYPQWNYITVSSFMFRYVTVSELRLLKRKKRRIYRIDFCRFNPFIISQIMPLYNHS